jgi:hypothetical protein
LLPFPSEFIDVVVGNGFDIWGHGDDNRNSQRNIEGHRRWKSYAWPHDRRPAILFAPYSFSNSPNAWMTCQHFTSNVDCYNSFV